MEIFLFLWLVLSIGIGYLASQRGRSGVGWTLLSLITSPLLGLLIVLLSKDLVEEEANREREAMRHREQMAALINTGGRAAAQPTHVSGTSTPASTGVVQSQPLLLIADELEKLAVLRDRGLLTDEEFARQKDRLLNGSTVLAAPRYSPPPSQARKTPVEQLTTSQQCRMALSALGCKVSSQGDGVWEIIQPSGVTTLARSREELAAIYERL